MYLKKRKLYLRSKFSEIVIIKGIESLIDQCNLKGELNIEVKKNELLIKAEEDQGKGWDEAFKKANSIKENSLVDGDGINLSDWTKKN